MKEILSMIINQLILLDFALVNFKNCRHWLSFCQQHCFLLIGKSLLIIHEDDQSYNEINIHRWSGIRNNQNNENQMVHLKNWSERGRFETCKTIWNIAGFFLLKETYIKASGSWEGDLFFLFKYNTHFPQWICSIIYQK